MLLATAATVRTGLYGRCFVAQGLELVVPEAVKGGRVADNPFLGRLGAMMAERARLGVGAFIGGCTEVPLVTGPYRAKAKPPAMRVVALFRVGYRTGICPAGSTLQSGRRVNSVSGPGGL